MLEGYKIYLSLYKSWVRLRHTTLVVHTGFKNGFHTTLLSLPLYFSPQMHVSVGKPFMGDASLQLTIVPFYIHFTLHRCHTIFFIIIFIFPSKLLSLLHAIRLSRFFTPSSSKESFAFRLSRVWKLFHQSVFARRSFAKRSSETVRKASAEKVAVGR